MSCLQFSAHCTASMLLPQLRKSAPAAIMQLWQGREAASYLTRNYKYHFCSILDLKNPREAKQPEKYQKHFLYRHPPFTKGIIVPHSEYSVTSILLSTSYTCHYK